MLLLHVLLRHHQVLVYLAPLTDQVDEPERKQSESGLAKQAEQCISECGCPSLKTHRGSCQETLELRGNDGLDDPGHERQQRNGLQDLLSMLRRDFFDLLQGFEVFDGSR